MTRNFPPQPMTCPLLVAALGSLLVVLNGCRSETSSPAVSPSPTASASSADAATQFRFTDMTEASGIDATYHGGGDQHEFSILEVVGGGVGVLDLDRDGLFDLVLPGGGRFDNPRLTSRPTFCFRNRGEGHFDDIAAESQLLESTVYSLGTAIGDYDADGFPDVVISGYGALQLFRNQGDGTFERVADAGGLTNPHWCCSPVWADFNGDGLLDLYAANYLDWSFDNHPPCSIVEGQATETCSPRIFTPLNDALFFSNGDGTFRDETQQAGLIEGGKGLGALAADFDQDADVDIYVANDTVENFLYWNDGQGHLEESALYSGVAFDAEAQANGSMGIALLDFNGDLKPDIWVTNFQHELFALYRHDTPDAFQHISQDAGLLDLGDSFVGFGTVADDFDRDGDEDIVVANGHIYYNAKGSTREQRPMLLENNGQDRFQLVTFADDSYFGKRTVGRGLAKMDFDNDGRIDLIVSQLELPVTVLRNETAPAQSWCGVQLVGRESNRDAIGAWAILTTSTGQTLRHRVSGGSFESCSDERLTWPCPRDDSPLSLEIHWPGGTIQTIELTREQYTTVIEPQTTPGD